MTEFDCNMLNSATYISLPQIMNKQFIVGNFETKLNIRKNCGRIYHLWYPLAGLYGGGGGEG